MASDDGGAAPPAAPGGKPRLNSPVTWVVILGAVVIAGGWIMWKRSQAAGSSGTSATAPPPAADTGATDYSGEVATLQTEIADLQSSEGQESGTTAKPPGGGTPKPPSKPAVPAGVVATAITRTGCILKWAKSANATSYSAHLTYQGKTAWGPKTVTATSVKVTGLTPGRTYTAHVSATGPGGTSAATNGPVIHTLQAGSVSRETPQERG